MLNEEQRVSSAEIASDRTITAIMPVYNAARLLPRSLAPLLAMRSRGEIIEILVVDDGSSDDSAAVARALDCRVFSSGGRKGPGGARNVAAQHARGALLWFVDADVIVHDDAATRIAHSFGDPGVVAIFGSYDDTPAAENFLSQYKNLVHHFYHQRGPEEASTFWAGCGVVRRSAFLAVGGFDVERYKYPSIEDIELGYRLRAAGGRIRMCFALQGTHLKEWRFVNLVHTEIFRRAIPWSRLILESRHRADHLNVDGGERIRAGLAAALLLALLLVAAGLASWWVPIAIFAVAGLANIELLRLFQRRKGLAFSIGGLLFHQLYYLYSSAAFVWCVVTHRLVSRKAARLSA